MKSVLLLAFTLLIQISLLSQEKSTAELKELFYDAEFFFAQEEYSDALYDYLELYKIDDFKNNANINYRIGICYLNISGQKEKSVNYLLEAIKDVSKKYNESNLNQKSAPLDAYLFLGNAYRVNNKLNEAISAYMKYKEIATTAAEVSYADQQINACNTALKFMQNPLQLRFTNLGDSINSSSSNFKGVISGNGRSLVYMNELPFYDAIYFSNYTNNAWSSPLNITPQIQSDGDQYVTSISYDGSQIYLTKEDPFNSDLYTSKFENNKWNKSYPLLGQDINTKFWESHASISKDGKTLYFTSNRKDGIGNMDIYVSKLGVNGQWEKPANLGPVINTSLNEDTPFITENDSMLYFSSQGHENMGGYDIFVSKLDNNGQWSTPVNLGYPINTTDDDLFFYPWNNAKVGFLSRIEKNTFGKEDLYAVQPIKDKELNLLMADFFGKGLPSDQISQQIVPVKEKSSPAIEKDTTKVTKLPISIPKEIELEPVYFGFDNFQLSPDGKKQLEKLYQLLNQYPVIRIRFIGHADAKGPADYNQKLSEKRANTVKDYISQMGINPVRMEVKGMGETNFVAINSNRDGSDNPQGRKLNRRVEYEIIGQDDSLIIIRMSPIPESLRIRD